MLNKLVVPVGAATRPLAGGLRVGMTPGCDLRVCRLGTVGWGTHSPQRGTRYDDNDAAVLAAIVDVVVAGTNTANTVGTAVGGGDGGVAGLGSGSGGYHNCSTFDATTIALSCFSFAFR